MARIFQLTLLCCFFSYNSLAQHIENIGEPAHFKHFRAALMIGHTWVPALDDHEHFFIPSWGFDLDYWFNPKYGLGLHNDLELHSFMVEKEDGHESLDRHFPVVFTLDFLAKPIGGFVFQFGGGVELEQDRHLKLIRAGVEYEWEVSRHCDFSPGFFYDTRLDAYDTWTIFLGFGKRF